MTEHRPVSPRHRRLSRRAFLGLGVAAGTAAAGVAVQGVVIEPRWLEVPRFQVPIAGLPEELEGYTIAHITDLHLRRMGLIHDTILDVLREQRPDLLVLTGDIVEDMDGLDVVERFGRLLVEQLGPGRIVATLGNWEHLTGGLPEAVGAVYERLGIPLLVNAHRLLARGIVVIGVDDQTRGKPDIAAAIEGLPRAAARILLTHSPALFDRWPGLASPFDIGLAGHTHGGQIRLFSRAPVLPSGSGRFVAGFYDAPGGRVYVSRGIGTSMLPVRFMCRPELPLFELSRA
jgi:uncharacterized protein